jgi:hypothetical protein
VLDYCYACTRLATSRDHAPPLCIFPKAADTPDGHSRRADLVTVPACDEHNLKKSKDDEYLMMVLVAHFGNNKTAQSQTATKVARAWRRRPHLAHMAVLNPAPARVGGVPTMVFQIDMGRFTKSMELIARALVFEECGRRIARQIKIWSPSMLPSDPATAHDVETTSNGIRAAMPILFAGRPFGGANKDVFQYRIHLPETGVGCVEMIFYEGFQVCALIHDAP